VGFVTYKVVEFSEDLAYRSSYIFLDGGSLSPAGIDSLKKLIAQKISSGASFEQLSDQYTMDGNKTHGDTGWFFGEEQMPKEFQEAVKNHKTGEIFFVDVSEKQWHYIVKKTYDDQDKKEMTVLRANGR
jgi:parvulin-like peptidyl-prolyl isomerase